MEVMGHSKQLLGVELKGHVGLAKCQVRWRMHYIEILPRKIKVKLSLLPYIKIRVELLLDINRIIDIYYYTSSCFLGVFFDFSVH